MHLSRLHIFCLLLIPVTCLFAFCVVPLGVAGLSSFVSDTGQFSLQTYWEILSTEIYRSTLWATLLISAVVTAIALPFGFLIAYYTVMVVRGRLTRRLIYIAVILPLFTSNIVRAFGFMVLLGRNGFVNNTLLWLGVIDKPLRILYSDVAVVIGLTYIFVPFMVLSIASALQGIDRSLLQASSDLGGGPWATFRKVVVPLSLPGVLAGSVIVFTLSVSAFVTPSVMLGGRGKVMSMLIYEQYVSFMNFPFGAALAITLMFAAFVVVALYSYVFERKLQWSRT
ncbi:ABC transporter permease [Bordetella bronchiseptica]